MKLARSVLGTFCSCAVKSELSNSELHTVAPLSPGEPGKAVESQPSFVSNVVRHDDRLTIILSGDLELSEAPTLWKLVTDLLLRTA